MINQLLAELEMANRKLKEKDKEIEQLKDLCDKYEEEHNTTFEEWKKDINIIDELTEEYINYMTKQDFAKKCNISRPYLDKLLKKMNRKEIYEFCKIRNKLRGDNK